MSIYSARPKYMCLLLGFMLPCIFLHAQLIDTVQDPWLTKNDSINKRISLLTGFEVEMESPELVTRSSATIQNGFDKYYIHVISTKKLMVEHTEVPLRGDKIYLAVVSHESRLDLGDSNFKGRALYLKGLVVGDDAGQKLAEYTKKAMALKAKAAQLKEKLDSAFVVEPGMKEDQEAVAKAADEAYFTALVYQEFRKHGSAVKLFLSHYYSRSPRLSIYTHPFGLPEAYQPPADPDQPKAKKKRHKRFLFF